MFIWQEIVSDTGSPYPTQVFLNHVLIYMPCKSYGNLESISLIVDI